MRAIAILTLAAAAVPLDAQFGAPPKQKSTPIKADLPAIKCGVCHALAGHLHGKVAEMRQEAPFGKVHEDDISTVIEKTCDPDTVDGRWITEYDIVEEGGYLELKKQGTFSHCKEECETIAKSCSVLVDEELDVEALVVALWKNKLGASELQKAACEEWSDRCEGKRVKAPKGRQDFEFKEKSAKDFEIADMMAKLGGMGGPGMGMYGPDDLDALDAMMGEMGGGDPYGEGEFGDFDPMGGMGGMEF